MIDSGVAVLKHVPAVVAGEDMYDQLCRNHEMGNANVMVSTSLNTHSLLLSVSHLSPKSLRPLVQFVNNNRRKRR